MLVANVQYRYSTKTVVILISLYNIEMLAHRAELFASVEA